MRDYRPLNLTASEIIERYSRRHESGCLIWTRPPASTGYGQIRWGNRSIKAHQLAWLAGHGEFAPSGMTIDHTCHNEAAALGLCVGGDECPHRLCVEIAHLRLLANGANSAASPNSCINRTHCPHGHEYSPENTRIHNNKRYCRACQRARDRGRPR